MIIEQGRCFVCLCAGHISKHCRSSMSCTTCKGRHHSSVSMRISKPNLAQRHSTARDGASHIHLRGLIKRPLHLKDELRVPPSILV
uniref:CCHC-type domain-containing protein n=1 Tax=Amphimedon queenslandica TaxID=400682 RepID=A0A1X7URP7_AMPQE